MMKAVFRTICVFLLVLCESPLRAETITHVFNTDVASYGKVNNVSYKQATMKDGFVYTCGTSSAVFGADHIFGSVIAINLPNSSSEVVVSPAIEGLTQVRISHYPNAKCPDLKVYISTDGISWGDPLTAMEYGLGTTFADVPKGNYYLKIANSSSAPLSIIEIRYTTDPSSCACLQVVSQ